MGQYGNQPDFATRAKEVIPTGTPYDPPQNTIDLGSAALYIGTGGTLVCNVVGGNDTADVSPKTTIFRNIPDGTFLPVIVKNVWFEEDGDDQTTCSDIIALY